MKTIILGILAIFLLASCNQNSVKGVVYAKAKKETGVNIKLYSQDGTFKETESDQDGKFEFNGLKDGQYLLVYNNPKFFSGDEQLFHYVQHKYWLNKYFHHQVSAEAEDLLKQWEALSKAPSTASNPNEYVIESERRKKEYFEMEDKMKKLLASVPNEYWGNYQLGMNEVTVKGGTVMKEINLL